MILLSASVYAKSPKLPRWETSSIGRGKILTHVDELVQGHLGSALSVRDAVKVVHPKVTTWKVYICYGPGERDDIKRFVYVNWSWKNQNWEFIDLAKSDNVDTAKARGIPEEFVGSALFKYRGDYDLKHYKLTVQKTVRKTRPVQGKIKGVALISQEAVTQFYQSHNVKFATSEPGQYGSRIYMFYEDDGIIQQSYEAPNE